MSETAEGRQFVGKSPRSIALILDTTAILAYAAGSMHVHDCGPPGAGWTKILQPTHAGRTA